MGSDLTRAEFGNSSFPICEFKQVDLSGGLFENVQFSETKFEEILLLGSILSDFKRKPTTFSDFQFSQTYPVRIHKLKKLEEVSDSFSGLHRKTRDAHDTFETDFEKLEDFQVEQQFSRFIRKLLSDCEIFNPEVEEGAEFNQKWLTDSVKQALCQMQKYLSD